MRLLFVTDSHLAAKATDFVANWQAAAAFAARSRIDCTIHCGDISLDAINAPRQLLEARAIVDAWPTPMRLVPGNHDVGDNRDTAGVPEGEWITAERLAAYRALFGDDWWSFDAERWTVVALDAQRFGGGPALEDDQWRWLERTLDAARGRPVVLVLHKPLYEDVATDRDRHPRLVPNAARDRLFDAIARHDVRLVLSGHAHQHLDRVRDGVRHAWLPSCAFAIGDQRQRRMGEKFVGVAVLELDGDDYRLELAIPDATVRRDIVDYPELMPE